MTTASAILAKVQPTGLARIGDALQTLRVTAMFLVVVIHASMSYAETRLSNTLWPLYDRSHHAAFDFFFYYGNGIAMPLFFLLSGLFAAQSYASRGPHGFLSQRGKRLLLPFVFGLATVVPLTYLVWGCGLVVCGQCTMSQLLRLRFPAEMRPYQWGPIHLWYLEYLGLLSLAYWGFQYLRRWFREPLNRRIAWSERVLLSPWKPVLLAVPSFLVLCLDGDTFIRLGNSFIPDPSRLLHYGVFFVVGTWLARLRTPEQYLGPYSPLYLLLSVPLFAVMGLLLKQHLQEPLHGLAHLTLIAAAPLFTWLSVLGYIGLFVRWCNRRLPASRYLSDASFWVYFCHVPVVVLTQVVLFYVAWPVALKFLVVIVVGVVVALATYELGVRCTFLETLLNGPRSKAASPGRWQAAWRLAVLTCALTALAGSGAWYLRAILWDNNLHAVIPGQVYRSGQPSARQLEHYIARFGLLSVINLYEDRHLAAEIRVGQERDVAVHVVSLSLDGVPSRSELQQLVATLDACRRPVLLHGRWGIGPTGLAAAVAELLGGTNPQAALRQFGLRYGNLGSPGVATVLQSYERWLSGEGQTHTPERFRQWAQNEYAP